MSHEEDLSKAVKGGLWLIVFNYSGNIINVIGNLILVRLIAPEDFGFYAFAVAATEAVYIFSKLNFSMAAVSLQKRADAFGTAYKLSLRVGLITLTLSLLSCFFLQDLLSPRGLQFFIALCFVNFIRLPSSVFQAYWEKDYKFGKLGKIKLFIIIISTASCLVAAFLGGGAWSLFIKEGLFELLLLLSLMTLIGKELKRHYNKETAAEIWVFSKKIFLLSSFEFLYNRAPRLFLGAVAGDRILAFFERSHYLSLLPNSIVLPFTEKVSFNYYAKNKDLHIDQKSSGLQTSLYLLSLLLLPLVIIVLCYPKEFIYVLLGKQWLAGSEILRGMSLLFFMVPVYGLLKHLLVAQGVIQKVSLARASACLFLIAGGLLSYHFSQWYIFTWFMSSGSVVAVLILLRVLQQLDLHAFTKSLLLEMFLVVSLSLLACECLKFTALVTWAQMIISTLAIYLIIFMKERAKLMAVFRKVI
jgi:O-antigen/teichoic acid export membrane protein